MANLNHIGIAVSDLIGMKKLFSLLDLEVNHVESVLQQGVNTHFLPFPNTQSHLELLEPLGEDGPISHFLKKWGPGLHHLSFSVQSGELEPLCEKLRSAGYRLLYEHPQAGAHGMKINFIHPASAGGILIEVMEPG